MEWNDPPTETIRLLSGEIIQHEVNGKSPDGKSAYAFVNGREIKLEWFYDEPAVTGSGKWYEQIESK